MEIKSAQVFIDWAKRKLFHHFDNDYKKVYFHEKEIWCVALGKNLGFEIDGKHDLFERPILIIKQYSTNMCFVLPLSTQIKTPLPWYHVIIDIEGKPNAVNISQGRTISSKRLLRKMTVLNVVSYNNIVEKFTGQFKNKV